MLNTNPHTWSNDEIRAAIKENKIRSEIWMLRGHIFGVIGCDRLVEALQNMLDKREKDKQLGFPFSGRSF